MIEFLLAKALPRRLVDTMIFPPEDIIRSRNLKNLQFIKEAIVLKGLN